MVMNAFRKGAASGLIKMAIFGLLTLAMGGMVFMDVGGFFRNGGLTQNDVLKVGSETISIQQFDQMARRALQQVGMTPQQAHKMGYMNEMLGSEIRTRLLTHKAEDTGLLISPEIAVEKLRTIIAPMVRPGQKPHEVLQQVLAAQNISEQELLSSIRRELSVGLIGDAIKSGFAEISPDMVKDLASYENEQRDIEIITFKNADFKEAKAPSDEELLKMYEAAKEGFADPEIREGQLIILNTQKMKSTVDISEDELKDAYDRNISNYKELESRTVETALASDKDKAKKILTLIQSGQSFKDAVKTVTGNTTDYIPPKKFTHKEIDESLKDKVFAAQKGDILGPFETPLGHTVLKITASSPENTRSYESVKEDIRKELMDGRLADLQFEAANQLDDLLASGAEVSEIRKELDIEVVDLQPMNTMGQSKDGKTALENYKDIADKILAPLFELNEGESSAVFELPDQRMAAVVLKKIIPKTYKPFESIKSQLLKQLMDDARLTGNKLKVLNIMTEAKAGKTSLAELAKKNGKPVQRISGLIRTKETKAPLNPSSQQALFEATQGELVALDLDDGAAIAIVKSITPGEAYSKEEYAKAYPNIVKSFQNETYEIFLQKQKERFGAHINEKLLDQAYAVKEE